MKILLFSLSKKGKEYTNNRPELSKDKYEHPFDNFSSHFGEPSFEFFFDEEKDVFFLLFVRLTY